MTNQNAGMYPFWTNSLGRRTAQAIASQDTSRKAQNQIPMDDDFSHAPSRVVMIPYTFQDSRRAGSGDKQIVGVGDPGYLFQRLYASPVLANASINKKDK